MKHVKLGSPLYLTEMRLFPVLQEFNTVLQGIKDLCFAGEEVDEGPEDDQE